MYKEWPEDWTCECGNVVVVLISSDYGMTSPVEEHTICDVCGQELVQ